MGSDNRRCEKQAFFNIAPKTSGRIEDRHAVMKLTFADRLAYVRGEGFRTPETTLPFKALGSFCGGENKMARPTGFEPVTFASGGRRSIQLSHGRLLRPVGYLTWWPRSIAKQSSQICQVCFAALLSLFWIHFYFSTFPNQIIGRKLIKKPAGCTINHFTITFTPGGQTKS